MGLSEKEFERVRRIQSSINSQYSGEIVDNINFIVHKLESTNQERDFFELQTKKRKQYEVYLKGIIDSDSSFKIYYTFEEFYRMKEPLQ